MTKGGSGPLAFVLLISACLGLAPLAQDVVMEADTAPALGLRSDGSRQLPTSTRSCGMATGWISPNAEDPQTTGGTSYLARPPRPRAIDSTQLTATKLWDSGSKNWLVQLDWADSLFPTGPFTVLNSPYPDFHTAVSTVEKGVTSTGRVCITDSSKRLECFEVANESIASVAVQDLGYDPRPAPGTATYPPGTYWWNSPVTVTASYLDKIPAANLAHFYDRPAKATVVTPGPANQEFAVNATFRIPADTRSSYLRVEAGARPSPYSGYLRMVAPGVTFGSINGLSWAPVEGKIFGADGTGGTIKRVDIFKVLPASEDVVSGLTNPLISKFSTSQFLVYVSGVAGATEILKLSAGASAPEHYAFTADDQFTRSITPAGIALLPDGSACFIADASTGKVVKIPMNAGPGHSTIRDWGGRTWQFPPSLVGIDADSYGQVYLGYTLSSLWYTGHIVSNGSTFQSDGLTCEYIDGVWVCTVPHFIECDRDMGSAVFNTPYVYADHAFCEAFNRNDIELVEGETGSGPYPPWFLGAQVWDFGDGHHLELTQDWTYWVTPHYPQRVILNNNGKASTDVAYPFAAQTQDRIIKLTASGWPNRSLHLRIIDPPDFAPYAPQGGWSSGTAILPYEGNDNSSLSGDTFGLTEDPNGSGAVLEMNLSFGTDQWTKDFYIKLPARYSGNNFRVAVQKINPGTNQPVPEKHAAVSSIYTYWKRVLVERDKMFKKGGLLAYDYNHVTASPKNRVRVWDWANVVPGQQVVLFQSDLPAESPSAEKGSIKDPIVSAGDGQTVYLDLDLGVDGQGNPKEMQHDYLASRNATTGLIDFSVGKSAAVGVLSGCSSAANDPPNVSGSCLYEPDLRDVEEPYTDGLLEFIAPSSGMGAVPYIPVEVPFYDGGLPAGPEATNRMYFASLWWGETGFNRFHLIGCRGRDFNPLGTVAGISDSGNDYSFIYAETIRTMGVSLNWSEQEILCAMQGGTDHELGHQFWLNSCSNLTCDTEPDKKQHDDRPWWKFTTIGCPNANPCLMDWNGGAISDGLNRFCVDDLISGDPNCGSDVRPDSAIRTLSDPIP